MPPDMPSAAAGGAAALENASLPSGIDDPSNAPEIAPPQAQIERNPRAVREARRRRLVEHLHRLGPSPLGHFLNEVERGASVAETLELYRRIDPEFVRALGGDKFAPIVRVIDGERRPLRVTDVTGSHGGGEP
ncbi:MAG: hypothetical protein WBE85_16245 [Methylocella sp.]